MKKFNGGLTNINAFTLAEVLITLGIIGVVAALTLPVLLQKHQEQVLINSAKKAYSEILQAAKMYEVQNDSPGDWLGLFEAKNGVPNSEQLAEEFAKYFKGAKVCKTRNEPNCGQYFYALEYAVPTVNENKEFVEVRNYAPKIILPDGVVIGVEQRAVKCGERITTVRKDEYGQVIRDEAGNTFASYYNAACTVLYFDTNGPKRPNKFGMDTFRIAVMPKKFDMGGSASLGDLSLKSILTGGKLIYKKYKVGDKLEN